MASTEMEDIIQIFDSLTHKPAKFLSVQSEIKDDLKAMVKSLYDFTKLQEKKDKKIKSSALPQLIIEDFDEEQIWQEIELQNTECWDRLVWDVANNISSKNDLTFPVEVVESRTNDNASKTEEEDAMIDSNSELSEDGSDDVENAELEQIRHKPDKKKVKTSIVDDKFFKLHEMEDFLLKEERKEEKGTNVKKAQSDSDDESVDYFENIEDDDDNAEEAGNDAMYSDFFDIQNQQHERKFSETDDGLNDDVESANDEEIEQDEIQDSRKSKSDKKVTFADMSGDSEEQSDSDNDGNKIEENNIRKQEGKQSEFELRQQRLKEHISRLEERTLKEAPWQLKGEIDALKRPQNSLLQEVVDFDQTSRPAPIITEQTTLTLEEIIKQRVKDKAWDDVVKKDKPVDDQLSFRKTVVLDQSKSKQSLAQVYEAEYLKQKQAISGEVQEEQEPEAHKEIREAMRNLFAKLDALTHYHYTPKPPQADIKIVSNTPAISMEEVAPVATSDAALLAPEEIKRKRKGDLLSKEERTQTDKNRERRKKKKLQKLKGKPVNVTQHRNTKQAVEAGDKSLKTSKAFFQQLNDDSTSIIKKKRLK